MPCVATRWPRCVSARMGPAAGGHAVRHLERELWDLRDAAGREIAPDAPERRGWLLERGAVGRLHAAVEQLLMKTCQVPCETTRLAPSGSLESRTATSPGRLRATRARQFCDDNPGIGPAFRLGRQT
jgi:hypothetical protein